MEAGKNAKSTAQETIDFILEKARLRKFELGKLKTVSAEFKRLETARIKADTINSLLGGRISFYQPKISKEELPKYAAEYKTLSEAEIGKLIEILLISL